MYEDLFNIYQGIAVGLWYFIYYIL